MSSVEPSIWVFALMLGSLFAFYLGLGQYRLKKSIEYAPTSKAIAAAPGICEVEGAARAASGPLVSPYEQKECVYYKTEVYKWSGSGKHRRRSLALCLESPSPFCIEDDTGTVLIMPQQPAQNGAGFLNLGAFLSAGNAFFLQKDVNMGDSPKKGLISSFLGMGAPNPKLLAFLSRHCPSLADYTDRVDVVETYVCDGDPIFAIGEAKEFEFEGKPNMAITRGSRGIFCISDGDEKSALTLITIFSYAALLISPLVFSACLAIFVLVLRPYPALLPLPVFSLLLMYGYVFLIHALEFYNSMITLRNQISKARANVDALVARRSALIPNLVELVSAYASHEARAMEQIAQIRSDPSRASQLFALAESYPNLKASESFLSLQQELSRTENWIAGARTYVADSIMLYNVRVQSFPYFLFAPLFGLKPMPPQAF